MKFYKGIRIPISIIGLSTILLLNSYPSQEQVAIGQTQGDLSQEVSEQASETDESKTKIELISTGVEPKQVLRYTPELNSKQTTKLALKIDVDATSNGISAPKTRIPETFITFESTVTKIDPNGDIHYLMRTVDIKTSEDSEIGSEIQKLKDSQSSTVIDSRGIVKSSQTQVGSLSKEAPKELIEAITLSGNTVAVHLPREAVGNGAKWKVISSDNNPGESENRITTYEITSIKDNVIDFNMSYEEVTTAQGINTSPGNLLNIEMPKTETKTVGEGQWTVKLNNLLPIQGSSKSKSSSKLNISYPGASSVSIDLLTTVDMQIN